MEWAGEKREKRREKREKGEGRRGVENSQAMRI
jgi:hypothetical protein